MLKRLITTAAILGIGSTAALAHITLEGREAAVGSTYKAVLRVPHGCEGKPTNTVRVQIPEGFYGVKPQPKAGWKLEKVTGPYAKPFNNGHTTVTEGVKEVVWSGGNLGDDEYDEFVLRGTISADLKAGETMYFPVVQECPEGAKERWIEIPKDGQKSSDLELPAPALKLR
ncbi:uncharacterized protein YcnI [Neorhizobium sp. 2083]|uniref:YcnI family copper-binding membrane protein n=1 Tax=Neorhizobium sp. 2083 TaxID=2817762 RepID=UPI00285D15B3|nr:DUF1775 domain-containing protein [Neorhizobium sp. 2083]MDR6821115.1 uncharacterized protein YcnI [Neorhizobium sp. 2083]